MATKAMEPASDADYHAMESAQSQATAAKPALRKLVSLFVKRLEGVQ